jgi:hypothetical protein
MITKLLVFLSSTSELQAEREALSHSLPKVVEIYRFELDRSRRASPDKHCSAMIGQADVFMMALGGSYGSVFPGDGKERSIVEWEFDNACERQNLEIIPFIKTGESIEPRQQEFIGRITNFRTGHWCRSFTTPVEFAQEASASLLTLLAEAWQAAKAPARALLRWPSRISLGVACFGALCMIAVIVMALMSKLTTGSVVACSVGLTAVIAMAMVFYLRESGGAHE